MEQHPREQLTKEIRRRPKVVGIFPDRGAILRLTGVLVIEQTDEWAEQRRYIGLEARAEQPADDTGGDQHADGDQRIT